MKELVICLLLSATLVLLNTVARAQGPGQVVPPSPASEFAPPEGLSSEVFEEDHSEFIVNPERGLYKATNLLSDNLLAECQSARQLGYSIIYTAAILPNDPELGGAILDRIDNGFDAVKACGAKAVVRFYYLKDDRVCTRNANGECIDPPRARILHHIDQLKPLLQEHQSAIMTVKAGLIGPWGEWHSSTLSNDADRAVILNALLAAVPQNRMVQVRTPSQRHAIFSGSPIVDDENAIGRPRGSQPFDGSHESRTGHHNDCFLSNERDRGTYSSNSARRTEEKKYISYNTLHTPMGGETCDFHPDYMWSPTSVQSIARTELREMHWTYLNGDYSDQVREALGADVSNPNQHIAAGNHTGVWPQVLNNLGYRLVLPRVYFSAAVSKGGNLRFIAQIKNVGYAGMFNRRPVYLVLHNAGHIYKMRLIGADPRKWRPGTRRVEYKVKVPINAATGRYTLSIWLPDSDSALQNRQEYSVRLAHSPSLWNPQLGFNTLKENGVYIRP